VIAARVTIKTMVILAPFIFTAHFLEESPGFVAWFNEHVRNGITSNLFWNVNVSALLITILVVLLEWIAPSSFSASIIVLWFSFLMFANAIFHITGAIVDGRYMPGLITAIVLYLPYYFFIVYLLLKKQRIMLSWLIVLVLMSSALMLIHGWLIIFRGSRLF
jgi:hypothetical protein